MWSNTYLATDDTETSRLSRFHVTTLDLLGDDEKALSKAFAYVLAKDQRALFTFLRHIGVPAQNRISNYMATTVKIEHSRPEGRTDIELSKPRSYHVIVECKVDSGRVSAPEDPISGFI